MKKKVIDTATSGVIATITPVFEGGLTPPMTFTKVNGFQSFNNDLFTINSSTGEITLNVPQPEGRYYLRYRATLNSDILRYEEDTLILDVASETAPSVSMSNTYDDSTTAGDILATITSAFPSPEFEIQYMQAPSDPASAYQTSQALEVDASGNIRWTGNISPVGLMKDFRVRAVARSGGMSCFSGTDIIDIVYAQPVPELPTAACAYPGTGFQIFNGNDPAVSREYQFKINHGSAQPNDWDIDEIGGFMNEVNPCLNPVEICGSDSNASAFNHMFRRSGGDGAEIIRSFMEVDTAMFPIANLMFRVNFFGSIYTTSFKPKAYIVYKAGNIAGSNPNETYDQPSWTVIGSVTPSHSVSTTVSYDVDLSNLLPASMLINLGVMIEGDYDGNYQDWIDASGGSPIEGTAYMISRYAC